MPQSLEQSGLQLEHSTARINDFNDQCRITTVGITANQHATLQEQGDRATGRRRQIGQQTSLCRHTSEAQHTRGGSGAVCTEGATDSK